MTVQALRARFVFAFLAAGVLAGCGEARVSDGLAEDGRLAGLPETVTVERIERGYIQDIVPALGVIRSANEVEVGAEVSGRVIQIGADFDDAVSAGQILARIDPEPHEAALARAEAGLSGARARRDEAEARLELVQQGLARAETLATRGAGSEAQAADLRLEAAQLSAALRSARANISLAESQVREARINLQRTEIRSPIDGFVLDRRVEAGQAVNASLSTPVLFVVAADLSSVVIEAQVAEADVGRIDPGMEARFTVDAYPGEPFFGVASPVRRSPQREGRFVSYPVRIEASDPDERLLPGMTASVEFIAAEALDVLLAPRRALSVVPPAGFEPPEEIAAWLRERHGIPAGEPLPQTGEFAAGMYGAMLGDAARKNMRVVFVWEDGRVEARHVRPGAESQTHFAVAAGDLEEGDLILTDVRDDRFQ